MGAVKRALENAGAFDLDPDEGDFAIRFCQCGKPAEYVLTLKTTTGVSVDEVTFCIKCIDSAWAKEAFFHLDLNAPDFWALQEDADVPVDPELPDGEPGFAPPPLWPVELERRELPLTAEEREEYNKRQDEKVEAVLRNAGMSDLIDCFRTGGPFGPLTLPPDTVVHATNRPEDKAGVNLGPLTSTRLFEKVTVEELPNEPSQEPDWTDEE